MYTLYHVLYLYVVLSSHMISRDANKISWSIYTTTEEYKIIWK